MSTTVAAGRQLAISARTAAWAGIVLGVLAAYVALPPLLIRTPVVSLVLAAAGVLAGVYATR
jgi:general nucleoside transport system permease protein